MTLPRAREDVSATDTSYTDTTEKGPTPTPTRLDDYVGWLVYDLEQIGFFLDADERKKIGGNFTALKRKGVEHEQLWRVKSRMVAEWSRCPLSPQQAHADLTRERANGGVRKPMYTPSSEAARAEMKRSENSMVRKLSFLSLEWDFTQDQRPPYRVWATLGEKEGERTKAWKAMQRIAREADSQQAS